MRPRTATRVRRAAILAAASSVTLAGAVAFAASSEASSDNHAWTAFSASSVVSVLSPDAEVN
ncbi:hypothetical protein [Hoyosella altamirensis]|uniref:Uncharacterized protein n=1 Tax=Hoyosella altamirensis TaxID=616997 RepID=A0A839RTU6_9ACTN|nr:hypothetical protein [Hoyosella altamirensis]MBB3039779.1 hypothetical protein [Hoyosella altamirensis]